MNDEIKVGNIAIHAAKPGEGINRCAKMGYPSGKKQDDRCGWHIKRGGAGVMQKVTRMIQCHDDHDQAAGDIY